MECLEEGDRLILLPSYLMTLNLPFPATYSEFVYLIMVVEIRWSTANELTGQPPIHGGLNIPTKGDHSGARILGTFTPTTIA